MLIIGALWSMLEMALIQMPGLCSPTPHSPHVSKMVGGADVTRHSKESKAMPLLLCLLAMKSEIK